MTPEEAFNQAVKSADQRINLHGQYYVTDHGLIWAKERISFLTSELKRLELEAVEMNTVFRELFEDHKYLREQYLHTNNAGE